MPDSLTTTVVEKVADRESVEPTELSPPLYEVIDPDAVNAIFADSDTGRSSGEGRIEFSYCGYQVVVRSDGQVSVRKPDASQSTRSTET
jgi:hypothetical protein